MASLLKYETSAMRSSKLSSFLVSELAVGGAVGGAALACQMSQGRKGWNRGFAYDLLLLRICSHCK